MKFIKSLYRNIVGASGINSPVHEDQCVSTKQLIKVAVNIEPRTEITLSLVEQDKKKYIGNESWLLDIVDGSGASLINWDEYEVIPPLEKRNLEVDHKPALLMVGSGEITIDLPRFAELRFLSHPWSGVISIQTAIGSKVFDLYSSAAITRSISIDLDVLEGVENQDERYQWRMEEQEWLDRVAKSDPQVISIVTPEWIGVRSATENLVPDVLLVKDNLNEASADRYANLIVESRCKKVMIGGFPLSFEGLVNRVKHLNPNIQIYIFWLSSFLQSNEDYAWQSFQSAIRLHTDGIIKKICFAKKGMAETISKIGVKTGFVESYVPIVPTKPSIPKPGGPHIGIWALAPIWRKTPYAMIAAVAEIENTTLFMVGQDSRAQDLASLLGVDVICQSVPIPHENMPQALADMHINLYVTLSECSPMLPLESLSAGVPCLFGPNSHLFEDHPYLHSRLVVPYPDRSDVIAAMIRQALDERGQIINEYSAYIPGYILKAKKSLETFLED